MPIKAGCQFHAHYQQTPRAGRRQLKKLRTWLGRVIRDIRRKVSTPDSALEELLQLCERLHAQQRTDKKKLYSLHEPEVMCISKGKAHKRYEFGQKVSVTTTNRGNWIVGINLCEGNPYDGHTLAKAIATTERVTSVPVTNAFVDKGYRGHGYQGTATIHLAGSSTRRLTRTQKQRRKRRSAVEPKIGKDKRYKRGIRVGYPLKTERNYAPIRTDPPHSGPRAGGATAPILRVRGNIKQEKQSKGF